jgi:Methyltransferase domain
VGPRLSVPTGRRSTRAAQIARRLGPLRPILRPIWHRLRPLVDQADPASIPVTAERWRHRLTDRIRRARGLPGRPIRPLANHELVELAAAEPYYRVRREYMAAAAAIADEMIRRKRFQTALEVGPHLRPLIVGADVMDVVANDRLQAEGRRIIHSATVSPWPFADHAYDLFVALQVWEHLGTRQAAAFREVRRVARNAILSLPIDWVMDDPTDSHHGLTHERVLSWFAPATPTRVVVGNPGRRKRLIYVFEDLAPAGHEGEVDTLAP